MSAYWLRIDLLSDTTFGRGDGVAGLVDVEVQHDEYGLPFLGGRTLKGLLTAASAELLFALRSAGAPGLDTWEACAKTLFGEPGSREEDGGNLHVGDAHLPDDLRTVIAWQAARPNPPLKREQVLESLTALRRQTAMDVETGAPKENTLRTVRVILRDTPFAARLDLLATGGLTEDELLAYLAACAKAFRRAGTERNRGRGKLAASLYGDNPFADDAQAITESYFERFAQEVSPA